MARRADVVAAHSLDHVAFDVPSLADAKHFYSAFGLDVNERGNTLEVGAHGDPRPWLVLREGGKLKQLRHISFGVYEGELAHFREKAASLGLASMSPLTPREHESVWVRDPHGVAVELFVAPKRTPEAAAVRETPARLKRNAPLRASTKSVRPTRLSHALLFSPDIAKSQEFYTSMVGLRLSDDAGAVAFMHAPHGSDHHVVAFAKSTGSGLHHVSWNVDSLEDVGIGAMQMAEAGFTRGWGVGRHVLGSNYFQYVRDPWGSYCEYSFDIDYVSHEVDWPASQQKPEDGFYLWGPPPPADFVTNFELAT